MRLKICQPRFWSYWCSAQLLTFPVTISRSSLTPAASAAYAAHQRCYTRLHNRAAGTLCDGSGTAVTRMRALEKGSMCASSCGTCALPGMRYRTWKHGIPNPLIRSSCNAIQLMSTIPVTAAGLTMPSECKVMCMVRVSRWPVRTLPADRMPWAARCGPSGEISLAMFSAMAQRTRVDVIAWERPAREPCCP